MKSRSRVRRTFPVKAPMTLCAITRRSRTRPPAHVIRNRPAVSSSTFAAWPICADPSSRCREGGILEMEAVSIVTHAVLASAASVLTPEGSRDRRRSGTKAPRSGSDREHPRQPEVDAVAGDRA